MRSEYPPLTMFIISFHDLLLKRYFAGHEWNRTITDATVCSRTFLALRRSISVLHFSPSVAYTATGSCLSRSELVDCPALPAPYKQRGNSLLRPQRRSEHLRQTRQRDCSLSVQ